ncbi:MAG TPA: hypothetical protein VNT92_09345, partial [Acidimicrobiia bacterium]|nr:hypothetical protein [Acidimicrobiia bacterium]
EGRAVRKEDGDEIVANIEHEQLNPASPIHLPNPSYFPFFFALGLPLMFYGVIYHKQLWGKGLIGIGLIIALAAVIGWAIEPLEEPHGEHGEEDDDDEEEEEIPPSPPSAVLPPAGGEMEPVDD